MTEYIKYFINGILIGAANVIPGVSGGTIALITGIYQRLIDAVKSFDTEAAKLLFTFKLKDFIKHVDGWFLGTIFAGVAISIISLAKLLKWLLETHEMPTMGFFFGLILVSVFYVGKTVRQWNPASFITLLTGTCIAVSIALLAPATENDSFIYLIACGVAAICSMILPGISGSFILILMGNYILVLSSINGFTSGLKALLSGNSEEAITTLGTALMVITPVGIGCIVGIIAFSHLISYVYKRHHDATVAMMTGFVLGSLAVIWPWKSKETLNITVGEKTKEIITGYNWNMPVWSEPYHILVLFMIAVGVISLIAVEKKAGN